MRKKKTYFPFPFDEIESPTNCLQMQLWNYLAVILQQELNCQC